MEFPLHAKTQGTAAPYSLLPPPPPKTINKANHKLQVPDLRIASKPQILSPFAYALHHNL